MKKAYVVMALVFGTCVGSAVAVQLKSAASVSTQSRVSMLARGTMLDPFQLAVRPIETFPIEDSPITIPDQPVRVRPGPFTPPPRSPYAPPPR